MASKTPAQLFRGATSMRSLMSVYRDHVRQGSARGRDGVPPDALAPNIKDVCKRLSNKLRDGDHRFTQYRELLMSKGAGKNPRIISVPAARDRIVLRSLADFLGQVYPDARGVIPQVRVGEVRAALSTGKFDAFVRLDVRDFYPSILHDQIRVELGRRIRKPEILKVILEAVRTPTVPDGGKKRGLQIRGVPQGLAISNVIAELVAAPIDAAMKDDVRCDYIRFVDDILILCHRRDAQLLSCEVSDLFKKQGLEVYDPAQRGGKSSIGSIQAGFNYLGYTFSGDVVSVRSSSVHKVESSLARAFTRYKKSAPNDSQNLALSRCEWFVNLTITGCVYKGVARGWLQYFRQVNDLVLLKKLDATVRRFERRFEIPSSFRSKRFMRAYFAIHHPNGGHFGYVPNFDRLPASKMRIVLVNIIGIARVDKLSDLEVSQLFDSIVGKAVLDLERDIGSIS